MDNINIVNPTGASADCTRFEAQCGGHMERDLDQAEQAWMTTHQSACVRCAALVCELEALVTQAQTLPGIAPSRDLWSGIESRLDTAVVPISAAATHTRTAHTVSVRTLAIAATMLVAVTSGFTWRIAARDSITASPAASPTASPPASPTALPAASPPASPAASPTASPAAVASTADNADNVDLPGASVEPVAASPSTTSSVPVSTTSGSTARLAARNAARNASLNASRADRDVGAADVVYEREISALRRIVDDRFVELDTVTVQELRRNLDIIDRAIGDSRKALARDPRSALLATQLDRALETKLALLRRVALL